MNKRLSIVIGTAALAAVVGLLSAGAALAQTTTPPAVTPQAQTAPDAGAGLGRGDRLGFGFSGGSTAVFDAQAAALNLTPAQLFDQLHSGKTLSEIAQAQGVDLATVQAAAQAAETQAMKDNIDQAVADGAMTQAQADWLLEGLDKGYLNGLHGFGFGGGHGRGHGGPLGGTPGDPGATQPAPTAPAGGAQS